MEHQIWTENGAECGGNANIICLPLQFNTSAARLNPAFLDKIAIRAKIFFGGKLLNLYYRRNFSVRTRKQCLNQKTALHCTASLSQQDTLMNMLQKSIFLIYDILSRNDAILIYALFKESYLHHAPVAPALPLLPLGVNPSIEYVTPCKNQTERNRGYSTEVNNDRTSIIE
jgi:hypothetical protein